MAATTGHTSSLPTEEDLARYGVIGHPISHSLSPLIHRYFARQTNQPLSYTLVEAPEVGFESVAGSFFEQGGAGLNVTLPFKQQAYALVDQATPAAELAGAVNTIRRSAAGLEGHNTDGAGLVQDLEHNLGWSLGGARILLIGAGGASRGALGSLLACAPETLVLTNRTPSRAMQLVADVAPNDARIKICAAAELSEAFDVVINATSASLAGQGALVPSQAVAGARCYDMLYAPTQTVFAGWAMSHGALEASDGLGMLLEQAAEAFSIWHGVRPDTGTLLAHREALFAAKRSDATTLDEFMTAAQSSAVTQAEELGGEELDRVDTSATREKTRFIAGAVCPQCREIDRIVVRVSDAGREQACIACGYSQPAAENSGSGLVPRGKPERLTVVDKASTPSQPVRFIDPESPD